MIRGAFALQTTLHVMPPGGEPFPNQLSIHSWFLKRACGFRRAPGPAIRLHVMNAADGARVPAPRATRATRTPRDASQIRLPKAFQVSARTGANGLGKDTSTQADGTVAPKAFPKVSRRWKASVDCWFRCFRR